MKPIPWKSLLNYAGWNHLPFTAGGKDLELGPTTCWFGSLKDHHALSEFMKEKGYIFNPDIQNYELQADVIEDEDDADEDGNGKANASINTNNLNQEDAEALQLVMENKDKLKELLEMGDSTTTLPRYSLSGIRISKTIQFSRDLNDIVKEFSEDKGINQREFFEMAAIEFLKKYGYSAEVKGLLG